MSITSPVGDLLQVWRKASEQTLGPSVSGTWKLTTTNIALSALQGRDGDHCDCKLNWLPVIRLLLSVKH